ncbi:MAG: RluA family pseudouridine synthase [Bifidobacteriaceae bacterium]|jgi:23S rRNA pseudouridine1911/1915/1917 synthase|nr:RluA family pseudouridine synthase [Bifidobacteriaceae bacterium]
MRKNGDKMQIIEISADYAGKRLDIALSQILKISRAQIQELLINKKIISAQNKSHKNKYYNNKSYIVQTGDKFKYDDTKIIKENPLSQIPVLYSDDEIIVVDKPARTATHPAKSWTGPDVWTSLIASGDLPKIEDSPFKNEEINPKNPEPLGTVSRLDALTSGVLLLCKTPETYAIMMEAYKNHTDLEKRYLAVTEKHLKHPKGIVDAAIKRSLTHKFRFTIDDEGKKAITHYEVKKSFADCQLLDIELLTGRTHQIRVHFSHLGHPVLGDIFYGASPNLAEKYQLNRVFLHSASLKITHPKTGEKMHFQAPLPDELQNTLEIIKQK